MESLTLASISAQAEMLSNVQFRLTSPVFQFGRGLGFEDFFCTLTKVLTIRLTQNEVIAKPPHWE